MQSSQVLSQFSRGKSFKAGKLLFVDLEWMTLSILLQVNENWRFQTIISQYLAYEFRTREATRQLVIFQMLYDLSNNMEKNYSKQASLFHVTPEDRLATFYRSAFYDFFDMHDRLS